MLALRAGMTQYRNDIGFGSGTGTHSATKTADWDKSRHFNSLRQVSRPLKSRYKMNGKCSSVFAAVQFSEKKERHSAQKTSFEQQNERAVFRLTNARACWKATALQKQ